VRRRVREEQFNGHVRARKSNENKKPKEKEEPWGAANSGQLIWGLMKPNAKKKLGGGGDDGSNDGRIQLSTCNGGDGA